MPSAGPSWMPNLQPTARNCAGARDDRDDNGDAVAAAAAAAVDLLLPVDDPGSSAACDAADKTAAADGDVMNWTWTTNGY